MTQRQTEHCCSVCPEKKDQTYFLHSYNKFVRIAVIFGMRHRECTGKLLVQMFTSSAKWKELPLLYQLNSTQLSHNARTDNIQG